METIQINEVINKVSKANKPYKVFNTSTGQVSAFETEIVKQLEANIGKSLNVEIVARNGFLNCTKVYAAGEQPATPTLAQVVTSKIDVSDAVIENYCTAMKALLQKLTSKQA